MIMEYNKKKMCGSFCHFLFFFLFFNLMLLSFIFENRYFHGGVPFHRACFCFHIVIRLIYSGCSHHSKRVLAKKTKTKHIVPACDT